MLQKNSTQKLKSQLLQFGLNPQEWTLERISSTLFLVHHPQKKGLSFIGRCKFRKSQPHWKSLEVFSL